MIHSTILPTLSAVGKTTVYVYHTFYSARNARMASAVLATAIPSVPLSVCLSVCPSHAGIASKRRHVARCSLHCRIAKCDQGSQFLSAVMKEMCRLLSLKQLVTTPYHPICNGLIEKFNGTLKNMLRHMCAEKPKDWDRYVGPLLFAYRKVKQDSLGYLPLELL